MLGERLGEKKNALPLTIVEVIILKLVSLFLLLFVRTKNWLVAISCANVRARLGSEEVCLGGVQPCCVE
jgi:hypothetical protein